MDAIIKVGIVLIGCYAGVVGGFYGIQRSLMYIPSQELPSPAAAGVPEMSEVRFRTADGLELVSWYRPATVPDGAEIVYFHGNGGNIAGRASKVRPHLDAGYGLLLVGYRGFGGNPGSPSEAGPLMDGRAALDFLAERKVAPERIVLMGESLGTGVAVQLASQYPVAAVLLEAPYTSAAEAGQRAYPYLPVKLLIRDRFNSLSRIDQIGAPLLVVHGERDAMIPVALGRQLFEAAPEPKQAVYIPEAGHADLVAHGLVQIQLDFLRRHLGDRGTR